MSSIRRFTRDHAQQLHVAQETRRAGSARADDHAYSQIYGPLPRSPRAPDNFSWALPLDLPRKYRNTPTQGFDSKREAARYGELRMLLLGGKIRDLRTQVQYLLIPAQYEAGQCVERAWTYTADFVYTDTTTGAQIVEDAKGYATDRWPLIRKMMRFVHGISVVES